MARPRESSLPLFDWRPPEAPAVRYEQPETVRAASLAASFVRAMQLAEEASGKSREEIASQ